MPSSSNLIYPSKEEAEKLLGSVAQESNKTHITDLEKHRQKIYNRKSQERIGRAAIPPRFRDRTFDNYIVDQKNSDQKKHLKTTRRYADNFINIRNNGTSMLFVGEPGTGKTHLSCAILNKILMQGYSGLFISSSRAVTMVFDTYKNQDSTLDVMDYFIEPDLLVLDEFAEQSGKSGETQVLFRIINERYERKLPIILIANDDDKSINVLLKEKGLSRLQEGGGLVLLFNWENYRKNIKYKSLGN